MSLVPDTVGLTKAVGIAVITWLDLVKIEVEPRPLDEVILASKYLPNISAGMERIELG